MRGLLALTDERFLRVEALEASLADEREGDEAIPALVDPAEAAEILGVSRPTVLAMLERGELVHARIGQRGTVILRSSVEKAQEARAR